MVAQQQSLVGLMDLGTIRRRCHLLSTLARTDRIGLALEVAVQWLQGSQRHLKNGSAYRQVRPTNAISIVVNPPRLLPMASPPGERFFLGSRPPADGDNAGPEAGLGEIGRHDQRSVQAYAAGRYGHLKVTINCILVLLTNGSWIRAKVNQEID